MGADERETIVQGAVGEIRIESIGILSANEVSNGLHAARLNGYRQAIADLRDEARRIDRQGAWKYASLTRRAADFLESRLSAGPDMAQVVARERDLDDGGGR